MASPTLVAHFGLGDATKAAVLRIEWPSGIVQELANLNCNQSLTITETRNPPVDQGPQITASGLWAGGTSHVTASCAASNIRCVLRTSTNLAGWTRVMVRSNVSGAMEVANPWAENHAAWFCRGIVR